ncbi:magnesium transporter NIPA-domain-containing protein [Lasiosphaeria miniovina]|uniref:Magnesium transporter NIPA-domain-containing protein n=1 Tax=Lasiosphaeria miniovina TaxID=1954250 RepID=A0AA40E5E6_9PEZI|nr:magnesium transporter NIPA-domain-containing protein [Lasiosphaeria miniovina]KAK0723123.1 magnesium transporter NIPA-domain-containing protein [Lasiosphaeria miniovina]
MRDLADWLPIALTPSHGGHGDKELQNWSSLIGIITAICGNVLIALALNVQRYAHIRLHRQRAQVRERARQALKNAKSQATAAAAASGYGAARTNSSFCHDEYRGDSFDASETDPLTPSPQSADPHWAGYLADEEEGDGKTEVTSTYLKSPYWWLGQVLIGVGEMGNFLAYGFAPASIVSPLGVVALVSNCIIAPLFFKEAFRARDFWGVIVAVMGAVTVVLSANQQETKLGPHEVWEAITTLEFEVYMSVSIAMIVFLMWLSPRYGNRTILIDLGLVGLLGIYTALATKGVSSMLSSMLLGAFATPVTYVLLLILIATAGMQIQYINKALQRFDSTQVIPIQFVFFTLFVIIGSAVLYRDFERTTRKQAVKFIGGCLLTFFGVFLITSGRPRPDEEEDSLSDEEGIEETIGLAEQGLTSHQAPRHSSRRDSESETSRRSSRASRVSFKEAAAINKHLPALSGSGFPTLRTPLSSTSTPKQPLGGENGETAPFLENAWKCNPPAAPGQHQQHPELGLHATSSDTVTTVLTAPVSDGELAHQPSLGIPSQNQLQIPAIITTGGVTPRGPLAHPSLRPHSHHYGGTMISPSPFSSTLSAVVADKLLGHDGGSPTMRKVRSRRSRPGLRNSLFVPQDEIEDEYYDYEDLEGTSAVERRASNRSDSYGDGGWTDGEEAAKRGFRGRARSLSHTLGGLFGVKRPRRDAAPLLGDGGADGEQAADNQDSTEARQ